MFVITGVTGNTGSVVADALLAKGKKVRVVVRDAKKGEAWKKKGAEVAIADLDDAKALARAFEGAEGAYLLSPPDFGAKDFLAARRKTADAVAEAVDASGVGHVVFLSSTGAQHAAGTGIIETTHIFERRLAKTKAKVTFLRAAYFLENWASVVPAIKQGQLPTFLRPDQAIPMVDTRDIGTVAAQALLEKTAGVIELAGPREYTSNDIAAIASVILGKAVAVQAAPLDAVVPTFTSFGISENVATLFRGMYEGLGNGTVAWEGGGARAVRGVVTAEESLRHLLQ